MLRLTIARAARTAVRPRTFATLRPLMAAGDTGATRAGGEAAGDAFTRREKAAEEGWIKQEELAKLKQLRDKLAKQKTHIEDLSKEIDDMIKDGSGSSGSGESASR